MANAALPPIQKGKVKTKRQKHALAVSQNSITSGNLSGEERKLSMKIVVSSLNLLPLLFPLINDRFLFFSKSSNYEAHSSFHFFSHPTIRMLIYFMRSVRALNRAANTATSSVLFPSSRRFLSSSLARSRSTNFF